MKITKFLMTGVLGIALMNVACTSGSDDNSTNDLNDDSLEMSGDNDNDLMDMDANHPQDSEEHLNDATPDETSNAVEHEEIKLTLLPPAITETLKKERYVDCKVERAFVIKEDDRKTYEVRVTKGEEDATFLFNEKGIRVDE